MLQCSSTRAPGRHPAGCLCQSPGFARLNARLEAKFSRRAFVAGAAATAMSAFGPRPASARIPKAPGSAIAFTNVRVFDGKSEALRAGLRVVVEGQKIKAVEAAGQPLAAGVRTIDCGGRVLMPGLIDAHWHAMMAAIPLTTLMVADVGYINLLAANEAERTLMRGFTSVRDMAGPSFSLKRAIDTGLVSGPRIWPSGAMISQTGGHGDFRFPYEVPAAPNAPLSRGDAIGGGAIADGVDRVLQKAREQLMQGASQLKLAAGGGVSSYYDPIDVAQYTEPEFRAAVDAAENWGTYVAVHAYTPRAIQTAIRGGVKCIEHGQLMDETTARMIADEGLWLSTQPFLDNEYANPKSSPESRAKQLEVFAGTDRAYGFARKYGIRTAWGTDILFEREATAKQGAILATMTRWYRPAEILKMATGTNAELLALAGPRNPYPGKIGVVEEGAWADLLVIDGDPLADIRLIADPDKNLKLVMKDGRIFKDTLTA
ncbi:amidohydrolase family protein [Enhydrobacter sp.]|jgi:imidazolonepropionase-like amidohydrolase|uniref:metal-dependent hydrolase family protein n=1 Tax=Enhydrobacter sp. TaxID=1894999 RepID=UPI00261A70E1|nr:amidohydrolase family protein [Enhydrobacter sp.]WIM09314.1 MAG: Prolidase [Enhydrobacter sp.]